MPRGHQKWKGEDLMSKMFYKYEWKSFNETEKLVQKLMFFDYLRRSSLPGAVDVEKPPYLVRYEQRNHTLLKKELATRLKNKPLKAFIGFTVEEATELLKKKEAIEAVVKILKASSNKPEWNSEQEGRGRRRTPHRRAKKKVNYDETVIEDDEFMWCDDCEEHFHPYCQVHGPPIYIPTVRVNQEDISKGEKTLSELTCPFFFRISPSKITNAGKGVFAMTVIPKGTVMGPYKGTSMRSAGKTGYSWQVLGDVKKTHHWIDAGDPSNSNWLRYVNCSPSWHRQNLTAFQFRKMIFYRALEDIFPGAELLIFYGLEYAALLGIDMETYHLPPDEVPVSKKGKKKCYQCKKCHLKFSKEEFMENHLSVCKAPEPTPGGLPAPFMAVTRFKGFPEKMQNEANRDPGEPSTYKEDLLRDIAEEKITTKAEYPCNTCGKQLSNKKALKQHILCHTKPYVCGICKQTFTYAYNLAVHEMIHIPKNGEDGFKCSHCGIQYAQKRDLTRHEKVHSTDRQYYICKTCNSSFTKKFNLNAHKAIHTNEKAFACGFCQKSFNRNSSLKQHERTHTGEKPYKCDICHSAFTQICGLNSHKRVHERKQGKKTGPIKLAEGKFADGNLADGILAGGSFAEGNLAEGSFANVKMT